MSFNEIMENNNDNDNNNNNNNKKSIRNEKPKKTIKVKTAKPSTSETDESNDTNLDDVSEKYKKKSQLEHIKDLPDTYIGSIVKENIPMWTFASINDKNVNQTKDNINDNDNNNKDDESTETKQTFKIISKDIEIVPGIRNITEEILINAFDNMNRVVQKNLLNTANGEKKRLKKVTYIKVWVDISKGQISIENDGEGIDVVMHPVEKVYVPQMIFGELLTSGNYNKDEEKITGGKNGYGAKLTNIFSTYFKIETVDRHRKLKYTQEYRDNMSVKGEPTVESYKGDSFTRITFIPDYAKFSLKGMSSDFNNLIRKRTIDMFACSRGNLDVYYNDEKVDLKTFTDYMKLYLEPEHLTVSCKPNDRWEIGACMSPSFTFQHVSFVNGINTHQGGKHVEYIVKQITSKMVSYILKKKKKYYTI